MQMTNKKQHKVNSFARMTDTFEMLYAMQYQVKIKIKTVTHYYNYMQPNCSKTDNK